MTVSLAEFGLDRLSIDDKLELAGRLWDDVVSAGPPGALLSDAQREELRRRIADAETHPEDYVAWEDVLAASLKRLSQ